MLEKWESVLDKGKHVCCLFMDISKAFDTTNHYPWLAKSKGYGFSNKSFTLIRIT